MRPILAFFMLALLCAAAFASAVSIKVLDNWKTPLYGTKVELLRDSVYVANATADETGVARFDVIDEEYIARVTRGGYPVSVNVVNVSGRTEVQLTIMQGRSYSVLYGTVYTQDGSIPDGLKLSAMKGPIVQSSAKVYPGGSYVLQFLEDGSYGLVANKPEYAHVNVPFSVSGYETKLMDVRLERKAAEKNESAPAKSALPFVSIVQKGELYAPIKVRAGAGQEGAAGIEVNVLTPDGAIAVKTDADGVAVVNAAKEGRYVFTYMGEQAVVEIGGEKKAVASEAFEEEEAAAQLAAAQAAAAAQAQRVAQKQSGDNALIVLGAGMLALLALLIAVGAYFVFFRKKGGLEHARAHGHTRHRGKPHS